MDALPTIHTGWLQDPHILTREVAEWQLLAQETTGRAQMVSVIDSSQLGGGTDLVL
jgi:hypothetical protein